MSDTLFYQADNKRVTKRYYDIINTKYNVDNRTAEEIIKDIFDRCGITIK